LKVTPTGLNTLRSGLPHTSHVVNASSVKDCTMSNALPQLVHL
jgi:hypothetical protein